jgi:drug/metabolite transporter (DMT)-like permease
MAVIGPVQPSVAGLYLQLASTMCVSFMALVAKVAGHRGIPVMEIVLARSLILLLLSTGMLARKGARAEWPWRSARCVAAAMAGGGVGCCHGRCRHCCPAAREPNSLCLRPPK